jgi:hypothetical protein
VNPVNQPLRKNPVMPKSENVCKKPCVDELKAKLTTLKFKGDTYKLNVENRVDQITKHCFRLRNKVQLQTELLVDKVYEFGDSLIAEIDKFENESINAFNKTIQKRNSDIEKLLAQTNKFCIETSKYLNGLKINEKVVNDSLFNAAKLIQDLSEKDEALKERKIDFVKNDTELDKRLLGSLVVNKSPGQALFSKFNLIDLTSIIEDYDSNINLLRLDNRNYVAFYIDQSCLLSFRTFDMNGKVLNSLSGTLVKTKIQKQRLNVVKMDDMFVLNVSFAHDSNNFIVDDQTLSRLDPTGKFKLKHYIIILSERFRYFDSLALDCSLNLIAANKSKVFCVETGNLPNCFLFNKSLEIQKKTSLNIILAGIYDKVIDIKMNENHVFFLCDTGKLRIVDIQTFSVFQIINDNASQIQLLPSKSLVLFDSINRSIHRYDRSAQFKKVATHDLSQLIESNSKLVCDDSERYSFYDSKIIRNTFAD